MKTAELHHRQINNIDMQLVKRLICKKLGDPVKTRKKSSLVSKCLLTIAQYLRI